MESNPQKHLTYKSNAHHLKTTAMEPRKTKKADLERKRPIFLQLGLIIALAATITAFEWRTPDVRGTILPPREAQDVETELIPIVTQNKELPKPVNTTIMKTVKNIQENIAEFKVSVEIDPNDFVEPYYPPLPKVDEPDEYLANEPFVIVENMPVFPGGVNALMQYLYKNTVYPQRAREAGISGTVYISFVIETDGCVTSIAVLREVAGGCTEEAIRVVSGMPRWEPGRQRGKAVRVRLNLPINFKLLSN